MIWAEFAVVIAAIVIGARVGGAGLGAVGVLGLSVLVGVFGLPPSSPPVTVLAIIVAVVSAAAAMQAAGGLDLLVMIAERALRANPRRITFIAPIVAYVFTFCSGTGHVAYAILPVIADVARKAGVRPERPLSISVIASQQAITASPLAAATAALLALLDTSKGVGLPQILMICVPSTFFGCMIGALSVYRRGVELNDDPEYRRRLASGEIVEATATKQLTGAERTRAIGSVATFLFAAVLIVAFGLFENLRPTYATATPNVAATIAEVQPDEGPRDEDQRDEGSQSPATETTKVPPQPGADLSSPPTVARTPVSMSVLIQIVMLSAAGIIMLCFGAKPDDAVRSKVGTAGVTAVISVLGLGWMGNCFFEGNQTQIIAALRGVIEAHPWVFAIGLFALSVVLFSQASTVIALMPVGIALGLPAGTLIAMFPAVNGYFFLPTYGTLIAAMAFDSTGTTRIGSFVLVHSFMRPGLVATISAVLIGLVLARVVL